MCNDVVYKADSLQGYLSNTFFLRFSSPLFFLVPSCTCSLALGVIFSQETYTKEILQHVTHRIKSANRIRAAAKLDAQPSEHDMQLIVDYLK